MLAEDVHSCRFLDLLEVRTGELHALGELPAARQKVSKSDRSAAVLAQGWRNLKQQESRADPGSRPK
jgi:hypothetical protein